MTTTSRLHHIDALQERLKTALRWSKGPSFIIAISDDHAVSAALRNIGYGFMVNALSGSLEDIRFVLRSMSEASGAHPEAKGLYVDLGLVELISTDMMDLSLVDVTDGVHRLAHMLIAANRPTLVIAGSKHYEALRSSPIWEIRSMVVDFREVERPSADASTMDDLLGDDGYNAYGTPCCNPTEDQRIEGCYDADAVLRASRSPRILDSSTKLDGPLE